MNATTRGILVVQVSRASIVDDELRSMVVAGATAGEIRNMAIERGLQTLRDDGIRKAIEGITSLDEVRRVTQEESAGAD